MDYTRVGRSRIIGNGVFARKKIPKEIQVIEYTGLRVPLEQFYEEFKEGMAVSTYVFGLNETTVIDASRCGNNARFIDHSCDPNCETYIMDDKVFVYSKRAIPINEELTIDYKLRPAFDSNGEDKMNTNKCLCGSPFCRGTMNAI